MLYKLSLFPSHWTSSKRKRARFKKQKYIFWYVAPLQRSVFLWKHNIKSYTYSLRVCLCWWLAMPYRTAYIGIMLKIHIHFKYVSMLHQYSPRALDVWWYDLCVLLQVWHSALCFISAYTWGDMYMFMFVRALQHLRRVKAQTIARKKRKSAQLWYARCVFVCVPRAFFTEYIYTLNIDAKLCIL